MRKEYGSALRDVFAREMKARWPAFGPARIQSAYLGPGERVFRAVPREPLHLFVILVPSAKEQNEFTVELGWSALGRFPETARPSGRPSAERTEFERAEFVCRLDEFYSRSGVWWEIAPAPGLGGGDFLESLMAGMAPISKEEAVRAVTPKVADALARLAEYGMPYLDELVRARVGRLH